MSQYPSPQPPPQQPFYYGQSPQPPRSPAELLAPARRAGVLMITLGVLFVLGGLCTAVVVWAMNRPELFPTPQAQEMQQQIDVVEKQFGTSVSTVYTVLGAVLLAIGATLGALGFVVRSGKMAGVITALVVASLLTLLLGLNILVGVVQGLVSGQGSGQLFLGVCVVAVPFAMLAVLLVWLVQAARASSRLEAARQQYQAQMWQYQQQQQMYQQPGPTMAPPPPAPGTGSGPGPTPGGYHQYPGPQSPTPPPAAPPPSTGPSDSGDRPDGPAAQE